MVPALSHKIPRASWYSGYRRRTRSFAYGAFTLFDRSFQFRSARSYAALCGPYPGLQATRFGLFRFRSPLLTESLFIFSSSGYLDVSVHRVPSVHLWIQCTVHEVFSCGFPHSDICGSQCICHSPQLFAAYHVFRRLSVPRHPSCALCDLTFLFLVLTCILESVCCSFGTLNSSLTAIALAAGCYASISLHAPVL